MIDKKFQTIIIEHLPKIIKTGYNEKSLKLLKEIGLCEEHAEEVLETVNDAVERMSLYSMGMKPTQFSGDLDNDPIFKAAIKILQSKN